MYYLIDRARDTRYRSGNGNLEEKEGDIFYNLQYFSERHHQVVFVPQLTCLSSINQDQEKMVSPVEARQEVRTYKECVQRDGKTACKAQLGHAVNAISTISSRDCAPFVEDFFQCYNHKFNLATCSDQTTAKLIRCQSDTANQMLTL
ncbi:unnamed protein product [Amoebophrya sp. A25]|nr:unnamed protein product [Amoebophrya sp. A25]|eukprot:GSA25T00018356001.1